MRSSASPYAVIYGSPGVRVRMMGFATLYGPMSLLLFAGGWMLHAAWPIGVNPVVALCLLGILAVLSYLLTQRFALRFRNYIKGARGEEIVARELALLPNDWSVFHGIANGSGETGGYDFDHIVLAPGGIWVIETKNWKGPIVTTGPAFVAGGVRASRSPVGQVRRETVELARLLREVLPEGASVRGLVCFASDGLVVDESAMDEVPLLNVRGLRAWLLAQSEAETPWPRDVRARVLTALLRL